MLGIIAKASFINLLQRAILWRKTVCMFKSAMQDARLIPRAEMKRIKGGVSNTKCPTSTFCEYRSEAEGLYLPGLCVQDATGRCVCNIAPDAAGLCEVSPDPHVFDNHGTQ